MSISHRTNRLKLVGTPSVEKLQNGRYKLTVTCSTMNSREDWYSANKARIFPDFGSLQSAEMSIDGLSPRTGEAYADMRLTQIESGNRSARDGGDYLVALTYETLGSSFVQVKDDNTDYELNGLRRVTRTSIAEAGTDYAKTVGTSFIDHQIDSETAVRCFLSSYAIDDTDSFRQVQEVWLESGVISIKPSSGTPMTQFESYQIVSIGAPASTIHAGTPIAKPSGTNIIANAVFFEPSIDNQGGFPTYSQLVINGSIGTGSVKVSEYKEHFVITDPGEMGTQGRWAASGESGAAIRTPRAISLPQTYRREGTVEVFLTTSNDADTEVSYNDEGVDWCSISFSTFFFDEVNQRASVSGSFRTFNKYLKTESSIYPASDVAAAGVLGVYSSTSTSDATGDTTYVTSGLYRSKVVPFIRKSDGTQLYLKTNVKFI